MYRPAYKASASMVVLAARAVLGAHSYPQLSALKGSRQGFTRARLCLHPPLYSLHTYPAARPVLLSDRASLEHLSTKQESKRLPD